MKKQLKYRLAKVSSRVRFYRRRGHGVHSPFVYSLVRKVFMRPKTQKSDFDVCMKLCDAGVRKSVAMELGNLHGFCEYPKIIIGNEAGNSFRDKALYVLEKFNCGDSEKYVELTDIAEGASVVVLSPYRNRKIYEMCMRLVAQRKYTSIDRRRYMIFFSDRGLSAEHFKL